MSEYRNQRGKRAAKVVFGVTALAVWAGLPGDIASSMSGHEDTKGMAIAGKPPKPGDPPVAPTPVPLNNQFFDWTVNGPGAPPLDFINSPFLRPSGALTDQFGGPGGFGSSPPVPQINAVKIFTNQPINHASPAIGVLSSQQVSYIFADYEGANADLQFSTLVSALRSSGGVSRNAYVGNFDFDLLGNDPPRRGLPDNQPSALRRAPGNIMINTLAYPGSPTFRMADPDGAGPLPQNGIGGANPNVRSALFINPLWRISNNAEMARTQYPKYRQIPWYTNFNNWQNPSLDSDNDPSNGYQFVTNDQLLSSGDVKAQVQHMRMRDVYSVILFETGTNTMTQADLQEATRQGWHRDPLVASKLNPIYDRPDDQAATYSMNPMVDGSMSKGGNSAERTGTMWSGRYWASGATGGKANGKGKGNGGNPNSGDDGKLVILASNLDETSHKVRFGKVGSWDVLLYPDWRNPPPAIDADGHTQTEANMLAGTHKLFEFDLVTTSIRAGSAKGFKTQTVWLLAGMFDIFGDGTRAGVGIPEPATFTAAGLGLGLLLGRRSRKPKKAVAA